MADSSMGIEMVGNEIPALKEALFAQQQLLQKLYNELDVEREASASAASEALSMILRLQGEKAAVKMEANQYKRLAEEKMCHAEEALAIFEDLIYQKEMEIASLEYQVQAYRYKLLSLGCNDIGVCETIFPENLLQRNENLIGDVGCQTNLRRNSMPLMPLKFSYQRKGSFEKERCVSPELSSKIEEENINSEPNSKISDMEKKLENYAIGDITSYWEQIRKLDERVREIADGNGVKSTNLRSRSRSSSLVFDSTKGPITNESGHCQSLLDNEATVSPSGYSCVHDVFEVPQTRESEEGCRGDREPERQLVLEGDNRDGKPDSVPPEAFKPHVKKETDWVRKMFPSKHQKNNLPGPSERVALDCHLALVHSTTEVAESHSKFQQLNISRISEIVEVERNGEGLETANREEEELKLLKEIQEQLNSIQSEIKSLKTIKSSPSYELPLLSLTEAMLHFWL
ncbi:uncharacterized protein LOC131320346 [Rhododendron vialii]|uniref:uncharacterized protein LOC131320346 n=1 Tax=Rhododendron vialii TaxID=182163 RepID=UPI0026605601|nr:uncharacterized protein LOC131320346 [Rhododendron vialii]